MIEAIMLVGILIGLAAFYLYKNKETDKGEYLWVGPGENPFKR